MRPCTGLPLALILAAVAAGAATPAGAQQPLTANTVRLAEGTPSPAAAVEDFAWIAGHWQAEALGGLAEEVWSAPLAGTMMGMFRLVRGDSVAFYEILTLTRADASVILRLKHFHPDLRGWEAADETVDFALVRAAEGEAWFDGITFRREGADTLRVHLALGRDSPAPREAEFLYLRVGSPAHRAMEARRRP